MVFVVVVIWGEFLSTEVSVFCFFSHGLCIAAVHGIPTSGSPPLSPREVQRVLRAGRGGGCVSPSLSPFVPQGPNPLSPHL